MRGVRLQGGLHVRGYGLSDRHASLARLTRLIEHRFDAALESGLLEVKRDNSSSVLDMAQNNTQNFQAKEGMSGGKELKRFAPVRGAWNLSRSFTYFT